MKSSHILHRTTATLRYVNSMLLNLRSRVPDKHYKEIEALRKDIEEAIESFESAAIDDEED
ncbi:hypothetical protein [Gorillibacterium massiliense]|uniref:hypothetical protein n=1 Tax=Gorillibacterium massiliense TaxID=1280390 RepID=UPI000592819A|nr:hypothetical protein [Gorillibacterium massiliense]